VATCNRRTPKRCRARMARRTMRSCALAAVRQRRGGSPRPAHRSFSAAADRSRTRGKAAHRDQELLHLVEPDEMAEAVRSASAGPRRPARRAQLSRDRPGGLAHRVAHGRVDRPARGGDDDADRAGHVGVRVEDRRG
jgi:hypothetical protein